MSSSTRNNSGLRHRIREHLRIRSRSRNRSKNEDYESTSALGAIAASSSDASSQNATLTIVSLSLESTADPAQDRSTTGDTTSEKQLDRNTLHAVLYTSGAKQDPLVSGEPLGADTDVSGGDGADLWSAAYREAVNSLGEDVNVAILKGDNVSQLFRQLEEMDKESSKDSAFVRDLAAPLASIEPTAGTVVGVVRSVTAIAISMSTADAQFAMQIGDMLEQISYIDDCDTLGQKTNKTDIYKALVSVYRKLLEFYSAAFEILTKKGAKLVMKMVLEHGRLPKVVNDFLKQADNLRRLVQKATWEIVEDIRAMLYDQEISRWLDSGKISRQSQQHASLRDVCADQACELLLKDTKFIRWYAASGSEQLAIVGDMGQGKTVAMAFLIDELSRRNERQLPRPKICYHYCRDDETGQAIHIFATLILSLLAQLSGLKRVFFEWYKRTEVSGIYDPAKNTKKLEEFLHQTVQSLDRPLFIVIDGLDECDRASRNTVLESLNALSQKTPSLKVLLSTRPEEEILVRLNETARIYLVSNAERDRIIVRKLVERQLHFLAKDVKDLVFEKLSLLARGSAIWTRMVIELIEVRRIRAIAPMRAFLENIPPPGQLSELYVNIFSRYTANDPDNQKLATTALEVLAVSRRPLSVLELAWAVAMGVSQEGLTTVAALSQQVDHQRILGLIQPFISHVDFSDVNKRQVTLAHKSVYEFIIYGWITSQPGLEGLPIPTTANELLIQQRIASLGAALMDICVRYLLLDDIGSKNLFTDEQLIIDELPQEFDLFGDSNEPTDYDPCCTWESFEENMIRFDPIGRGFGEFFTYASCHWLDHYGTATLAPTPGKIETLCQAGSMRLHNWITQNCRPGCTLKPRFPFDSSRYDPLGINALFGSKVMLRHMIQTADFDDGNFFPDTAMRAAEQIILSGDRSRLRILFTGGQVCQQLQTLDFFRLVMKLWAASDRLAQDWDTIFDFVSRVLDSMVQDRWGNELLCSAAGWGCMPILERLMTGAQQNEALRTELLRDCHREYKFGVVGKAAHQSIGEAVSGNHVDVVAYLLGQKGIEAHLRYRNSRGENVFHLASGNCNPAMFRLLVRHFKEGVHQTDHQQCSLVQNTGCPEMRSSGVFKWQPN
ncbi:hypothetical protein HMPREF1624_07422 [Sporothrix schenckii ATCC 58251]|uniref:NACHT domain-containing protein n=1 Tax=Sporothrix schenckii (strain ATCC 58251 / de Perez 2211183) TaxID=1391915 RepID=U7PNL0_SPOS1|nr:hypothetical protein HMPREF1624_07422 [Sporothrix schenckii ATCC 58251]